LRSCSGRGEKQSVAGNYPGVPNRFERLRLDVVTAWANYQNASLPDDTDEFMFATDAPGPTSRRRTASAGCSAMNHAV
jgi:hypothetical protein